MAPRKKRRKPSPGGLALLHLRSRRDWTQKELADRLGWTDESLVSNYERGGRPLHREHLVSISAVLGYPPEAVDLLMQTHGWIEPPLEPVGPSSPVDPTPEELGAIHLTILTATSVFMEGVRRELVRRKRERKAEVARQNARELWPRGLKRGLRLVKAEDRTQWQGLSRYAGILLPMGYPMIQPEPP